MHRRHCAFILLTAMILGGNGCGSANKLPPLSPVSGTVTLDGKPLVGADVKFFPVGNTVAVGSAGRTGPDGVYDLTCQRGGGKGAVPGEFKVTISKRIMPDGSPVPEDDKTPPIESPARESLAAVYSDSVRTVLKAAVPASGPIDFKIESKPGKRQ